MAVEQYIQSLLPTITENLLPDNSFVNLSKNEDQYVNGDIVKRPQRGSLPDSVINRSTVPAPASKRIDSATSYDLFEITTNPTVTSFTEDLLVSYDKKMSVLKDHIDRIQTDIPEIALNIWCPTIGGGRIFETTGTSRKAAVIPSINLDGTAITLTGNRKRLVKQDFVDMMNRFNRENLPKSGRVALLTSDQMQDLMLIPEFVDANKMGSTQSKLIEGSVGRLLGFDIFERSSVLFFSGDGLTKRDNRTKADVTATDCEGALFYHMDCVARAKGSVELFLEEKSPFYYGDTISALARFGADKVYKQEKGIFVLKDAVA